jgi:hypothetical protein
MDTSAADIHVDIPVGNENGGTFAATESSQSIKSKFYLNSSAKTKVM